MNYDGRIYKFKSPATHSHERQKMKSLFHAKAQSFVRRKENFASYSFPGVFA
jgi:hypothetical protein